MSPPLGAPVVALCLGRGVGASIGSRWRTGSRESGGRTYGLIHTLIPLIHLSTLLVRRYIFVNSDNRDGWIKAGKKYSVVLKPQVERVDESEDLMLVQRELQVSVCV